MAFVVLSVCSSIMISCLENVNVMRREWCTGPRGAGCAGRRRRQDVPLAGYRELCRELSVSGPGTFGELDSAGARSVLRRYSDAWFAAAKRRAGGDTSARYPRRRRGLVPVRWYHGTFRLQGRVLAIPVAC